MVVLIVAGDRTTPAGQADCTTIVERLREVEWSGGAPPIHIVPDADTGRWLLRGMIPAAGDGTPAAGGPAPANASIASTVDKSKTNWPFVERRHRTTDRRQGSDSYTGAHDRRSVSGGAVEQNSNDDRDQYTAAQCTEREEQIVKLIRQGLTNKEIAQRLGIVEDTVKKHLQHIYDKLGVRRRTLVMLNRPGLADGHAPAVS